MVSVDLNGQWDLSFGEQTPDSPSTPAELAGSGWRTAAATVPGNVELDLSVAGVLPPDLYMGNAIYLLRPFESYRWWYHRLFDTPRFAKGERVILLLAGVDCLAEVFVNGKSVGQCRNMLIEHRLDITDHVHSGENDLHIRIDSAVLAGRAHRPDPIEHANTCNWESLSVRKAPHMYGWDILPRLVSAGLWRGVSIEVQPAARFADIYWATISVDADKRRAHLQANWNIVTTERQTDAWQLEVELSREGKPVYRSMHPVLNLVGQQHLRLENVDLWWPRGSGEQALYTATLRLIGEGVIATHTSRIGIRTVKLERSDTTDAQGSGQFRFVVNGRPIYCRGTNHVPLDSLHSRDPRHIANMIGMLADLNCNMVRCWGGNVYEDHAFFDGCDQQGILVWQDFALACAIYPQTASFAEEIRREAESVVRKLRNHPSLALWAGNNEIDQAYNWSGLGRDPNEDLLSRVTLPDVCRRLDPFREYLPSSPYISPALYKMGDLHHHSPEDHLWGPRDDFKGPYYSTSNAHFVSEIGYHGCPDRKTMEAMIPAASLWPWQDNDAWLTPCVRPHPQATNYNYRIPLMAKQIRVLFDRDPADLDEFILASQASQAEALKYFIEKWRMEKGRRTGMLWWNMRDGWPVISDAIVDYFGRRKLAYEVVKRVQADACVSIAEPVQGTHSVVAVNDGGSDVSLDIVIRDVDSGEVRLRTRASAKADAATRIATLPASDVAAMWEIQWGFGRNHYLAGPRPFDLQQYGRWLAALGLRAKPATISV